MTRLVLVMGVGRSGTSAIAGALHQAGVDMGDDLIGPNATFNAKGHFESRAWWALDIMAVAIIRKGSVPSSDVLAEYRNLLAKRQAANDILFGIKSPYLGSTLRFIRPLLNEFDWRIVAVHRKRSSIVQSTMRHYNGGRGCEPAKTEQVVNMRLAAYFQALDQLGGTPIRHVQYEDVLAHPPDMASVVDFATAGSGYKPKSQQYAAAVKWLDAKLRHY